MVVEIFKFLADRASSADFQMILWWAERETSHESRETLSEILRGLCLFQDLNLKTWFLTVCRTSVLLRSVQGKVIVAIIDWEDLGLECRTGNPKFWRSPFFKILCRLFACNFHFSFLEEDWYVSLWFDYFVLYIKRLILLDN